MCRRNRRSRSSSACHGTAPAPPPKGRPRSHGMVILPPIIHTRPVPPVQAQLPRRGCSSNRFPAGGQGSAENQVERRHQSAPRRGGTRVPLCGFHDAETFHLAPGKHPKLPFRDDGFDCAVPPHRLREFPHPGSVSAVETVVNLLLVLTPRRRDLPERPARRLNPRLRPLGRHVRTFQQSAQESKI